MVLNMFRLLGLLMVVGMVGQLASEIYADSRLASTVLTAVFLGGLLFLSLVAGGQIKFRDIKNERFLALRCAEHPSLKAWVGPEHRFQELFSDNTMPECILAVANRHASGRIYMASQPARHHHLIALMNETGDTGPGLRNQYSQGFLTSRGRYVSRDEAYRIAKARDQIIFKTGNLMRPELYSEDVWAGPLVSAKYLEDRALELVQEAFNSCKVITIENRPKTPLAMGHHEHVVSVRDSISVIRMKMAEDRMLAAIREQSESV